MSESESDVPAEVGPERIFVAFKLAEARRAEQIFAAHAIEYTVAVEALGRSLFGAPRNGAVFSVARERMTQCVALLEQAGLGIGVIPRD